VIRTARTPLSILLLAILSLAGAACTPTGGPLGTPAAPQPSADASVEVPSGDATADVPSPSASAVSTPSAIPTGVQPTPAPTATPAPSPAGTTIVRAYFYLGSFTGSGGLVPVLREIPKTTAVASAAMRALLAGPSATELAARPAMYTDVPSGTRLLGISIANGVATVDLSSEFAAGSGTSAAGQLAQVTYTLTQFSTVRQVRFRLDGSGTTFGGTIGDAVSRADFYDQLPAIFVDRPAWDAAAGNPAKVSGVANVFEATFRIQIRGASGGLLADQQVMASCGTGCWGTFSASVPYTVTKAQWGTLRVFDLSAKDGTPVDVTEYPVWLVPAG
jgi:hypothetical protein